MRVDLPAKADIACPAERIFDLILDFGAQDQWLSKSPAYRGTHDVSSSQVTLGTTYREPSAFGLRNGTVIELERPVSLVFHQPMTLRFGLGTIDVLLRYSLTPRDGSTHVKRVATLTIPTALRPFKLVVVRAFSYESGRTLKALKAHADQLG